jgi:glutathione reductase (NADPH)
MPPLEGSMTSSENRQNGKNVGTKAKRKRASEAGTEPRMERVPRARGAKSKNAPREADLVVIGAGSGGMTTALTAARHGARVILVEREAMGGTCVNRGCVPKKMLTYGASLAAILSGCLSHTGGKEDWTDAIVRVNAEVARLQVIFTERMQRAGVELIRGEATISARDMVTVGAESIKAGRILIATGSSPVPLPVPGGELASTSDDVFSWKSLPGTLAVIGGGYIAVEQASILSRYGVKVEMLVREDRLLTEFDAEVSAALAQTLTAKGVRIHFMTDVTLLSEANGALEVCYRQRGAPGAPKDTRTRSVRVQAVLAAIGRKPNTHGLGLEAVGVAMNDETGAEGGEKRVGEQEREKERQKEREKGSEKGSEGYENGDEQARRATGGIVVDRNYRSSVRTIYAIGDAIDTRHLTPVAVMQGRWLADRLFAKRGDRADFDMVPTAVFCEPAVASVGLTEAQAIESAGKPERVATMVRRFVSLESRFAGSTLESMVKVVYSPRTGRVLGVHVLDNAGPEIIQAFALALRLGVRISHLRTTVPLHPTVAEELFG